MEASLFESQQEQTRRASFSFVQLKYYQICTLYFQHLRRTNEVYACYRCNVLLFNILRDFKIDGFQITRFCTIYRRSTYVRSIRSRARSVLAVVKSLG